MSIVAADPRACFFGLERAIGTNGNTQWQRVQVIQPGSTSTVRWFPIESYSEQNIAAAAGPGTYRAIWQPKTKRAKWPPSEPFVVGPIDDGQRREAAPTPPTAAPPSPTTTAIVAQEPAQRPIPPGYVPRPPANYMPAPQEPAFERYHHLAHEDAALVVHAVTTFASTMQSGMANLSAAVISVLGDRADKADRRAELLLAQINQPNPQLAALAHAIQGQNQQLAALNAAQQKTNETIEELAEEDEAAAIVTAGAEQTDGQKFMAAVLPAVIEHGPKIVERFWPAKVPAPGTDGTAGA